MKRKISLSVLLLTLSLMTFAQATESQKVEGAVEKLRLAMINADKAALDKLAADKLSYGHSSGKIEDKKAFIETFVSGKSDFLDISLTEQSVEITGNTAVVRHKLAGRVQDEGKEPGNVNINVLLIWIKQGQEWKLLARQAFK
ncbi:nuclear transport factor 2 family protein [Chryseosolibacter indicus]|uniref:DUF4440 domain-containing protein n=1 Tax=Chryseosolibacter indicus TaxID=2782351 RepID=A0ABS5VTD1_9BACT|nr:nuclear transport factor 2 family protein [Chryseosolibacter indicus]MBT1704029.1 DUF4440 domain-containing protein [Chryseosolibacter indicus]